MERFKIQVHSLSALAEQFDCYAEMAEQKSKQLRFKVLAGRSKKAIQCAAIATTFREAADILRNTVLTPPYYSV
jgi:hypothetical protein